MLSLATSYRVTLDAAPPKANYNRTVFKLLGGGGLTVFCLPSVQLGVVCGGRILLPVGEREKCDIL